MNLPFTPQIDPAQLLSLAKEGSPFLVNAAGRALGLGRAEQEAIAKGQIPWWTWAVLGVAVGFTVGARVERSYSGKLPAFVAGNKK